MVKGGISGPAGGPRPLVRCNQQIVIILEGRESDIDEDSIDNNIGFDTGVSTRPARIDGDVDVVIATRGGIILDDELDEALNAVRQEVIDSHTVIGWRVES